MLREACELKKHDILLQCQSAIFGNVKIKKKHIWKKNTSVKGLVIQIKKKQSLEMEPALIQPTELTIGTHPSTV